LKAEATDLVVRIAGLDEAAAWAEFLTDAERERVEKIGNDSLRARFVVSRGLRRAVLAECTGRAPGDLEFYEDGESKPRLVGGGGWDFNLSHAGDYVAVAAGRGAVGVDLEKIREVREMSALVTRYFHADEAAAWTALDDGLRQEAFFVLWSAREAAMKCAGLGLAKGLAVTRVDPAILTQTAAEGLVGATAVKVNRHEAPSGYVMMLARGCG
jgi:4'-phosphopantetheinyl transferase